MRKQIKRIILRYCAMLLLVVVLFSLLIVVPFRWLNPPVSTVMAERWFNATDPHFKLHQTWLSWDNIPQQLALAVVTSEDQRFPLHMGFDVDAIVQAIEDQEDGERLRGASTISQQVARNMYLWTGRSWFRKAIEAWLTCVIELTWGKQRILEVYLNIAEWGDGIFGIEAASRYYFGKHASQLSSMQAALLASTLPSPLHYNPAKPAAHLQQRAVWNLKQQAKLGGMQWLAPLNQ